MEVLGETQPQQQEDLLSLTEEIDDTGTQQDIMESVDFEELDGHLSDRHPPPKSPRMPDAPGTDELQVDDASETAAGWTSYVPVVNATHDKLHRYLFTADEGSFRKSIRNPITFMAPTQFSKPTGIKSAMTRLHSNGRYFLANYLIVAIVVAAMWVLTSPIALIGVICIGLSWAAALKTDTITIGGFSVGGKIKTLGVLGLTVILIVLFGVLDAVMMGGTVATVVSAIHAVFHKSVGASAEANSLDAPDSATDLDLELGQQIESFIQHV